MGGGSSRLLWCVGFVAPRHGHVYFSVVVSYQHLALQAVVNWTLTNSDIYPPVRQQPFLLLRDLAVRVDGFFIWVISGCSTGFIPHPLSKLYQYKKTKTSEGVGFIYSFSKIILNIANLELGQPDE